MKKQCTLIVSAAVLASAIVSGCCMGRCGARPTSSEKTLLVVPGVQAMVDLGFDLLEMNGRSLDLACYKGIDKVDAFEFFDRSETKWVHVEENQWKAALYPIDRYANVIIVGNGAAHDFLVESATWAKTALTPDGRRVHEVANAVDSLLPLSKSQWETLASKHGITIKSQPAPSRYDNAAKNRYEAPSPQAPADDHTLKSPFETADAPVVPEVEATEVEAPAVEVPAVEAPEAPAVEVPAAPAVEVPAVEVPEAPAVEVPAAPAVEVPAVEAPEAPAVEAPATTAVEVPAVEVPEAPAVEVPATTAVEVPAVEVPEAPAVEVPAAPAVEVPAVEVPEAPAVEVPAAPAVEVPAVEAPEAPAVEAPATPAVEVPAVEAPEAPAVEVKAPVIEALAVPEIEAPAIEVKAPAVEAKAGEIVTISIPEVVVPTIEVVKESAEGSVSTSKLVTVVVPASGSTSGDRVFLPGGNGAGTNAVETVPAK